MQKFENWTDSYFRLLKSDRNAPVYIQKLETLGLAAYMTGRNEEAIEIMERSHKAYMDQHKIQRGIRCAFWLGLMLMNSGEKARSNGWIARIERLLDDLGYECPENGLILIPTGLNALYSGDVKKAQKVFSKAVNIGEQFDDIDLIALARLGLGQALIKLGNIDMGIKLLDETMITVQTEEVYPVVTGIVYCAVIEACHKVWDMQRAREWTAVLTKWLETHSDIVPFRGQCLIRRAQIIQFHGDWDEALKETNEACTLLTRPPGEPAAGEAFYRKAELLRLLGKFDEAEECYHEAAKWNRKPQPGLALLRLAQGQDDTAEISIRNILQETKDLQKRAELLPALVHIMYSLKKNSEVHELTKELCVVADQLNSPYLHAITFHYQGTTLLAEGNHQSALKHLQKSLKIWNSLDLPYESAHTRELKGLVYRELKDRDNSKIEFLAAQWIFEQLQAQPDLKRINRFLNNKDHYDNHGLSLRELQVLQHVAAGMTNKSVAGELFISERTVDRHMSNIFTKLNVSSRVEATTLAIKKKLLDIEIE